MKRIKNGTYHLFVTAFADFGRNKIRTFLTSLGIMIGVMSVVLLIALGLGLKNYIRDQFEGLGANMIMVMPGSGFGGGGGFGPGMIGGISFDEQDIASLKRIPELDYVVPVDYSSTTVETENKQEFAYFMGVNEDIFPIMNKEFLSGHAFDASDVASRAKVAVIGGAIAEKLFDDPESAINKTIRIKKQRFKVIGVTVKTGDPDSDNGILVPYKTLFGTTNKDKTFWAIYLGVKADDQVAYAKQRTEETLLRRYEDDQFSVTEASEFLSTMDQIFAILNLVLIAIGSISLLVGGVGIMNIMYATVTERTKEVGIRRAIGATKKDILKQFLVESVTLSVMGGTLGLLASIIIVLIMRFFFPASINAVAVIIAFGVSSLIGVFFGVFPARRAANLPPIEAIRYE